jgi:hypothetical protein
LLNLLNILLYRNWHGFCLYQGSKWKYGLNQKKHKTV